MEQEPFKLLSNRTSAGFALVKDLLNNRVCVQDGNGNITFVSEFEDNLYEYSEDEWRIHYEWLSPDRLAFYQGSYTGLYSPYGEVIFPIQFKLILPVKEAGLFILKNQQDKCGAVDKEGNILYPFQYEYVELRNMILERFSATNYRISNDRLHFYTSLEREI
ncbi:MAG: hypothetical protein MST03_04720 [Bacteroidales bacterium]|nr:hypothetical protein [Bacteroidales bacterium]